VASPQHKVPRVSVVTAAHNAGQYLAEAIDGILSQSFEDFEYIIIDDGSTDSTADVLSRVADSRVRIVRQAQMGVARSLNRGTALARGEYLARQDADDLSLPERLAVEVEFLDRHSTVGLVGSCIDVIDASGEPVGGLDFPESHENLVRMMQTQVAFHHGSLLIRRAALVDVGGYRPEFPVSSDVDMYLRVSERWKVATLPDVYYLYRQTGTSLSNRAGSLQPMYVQIARILAQQRKSTGRDLMMFGETTPSQLAITPFPAPDTVEQTDGKAGFKA
jgi:glycosyltransferase involved in cell wall biosynthesis